MLILRSACSPLSQVPGVEMVLLSTLSFFIVYFIEEDVDRGRRVVLLLRIVFVLLFSFRVIWP